MLAQSLFYTVLVSLPLLSNTLPLPNSHQENHIIRAVRDLSHQQKLAVRAIASPSTTTPESTPIIWTSVEPTTPPATLLFYSAATGITTTPTLPLYTPNIRSTTTIPAQQVVYPTLPPTVQQVTSIIPDVQPLLQVITYNYVAPSKPTATIIFATPTLAPSPTFIAIGTSTYAIASTVVDFRPNFALVTPLVQVPQLATVTIGTEMYPIATAIANSPHSVIVGPHSFAPLATSTPSLPSIVISELPNSDSDKINSIDNAGIISSTFDSTTSTSTSTTSENSEDALNNLIASVNGITTSNSSTTLPILPVVPKTNIGTLNYYPTTSTSTSCQTPITGSSISLSSTLFNTSLCGQTIKITYGNQIFSGVVGDTCVDCGEFDIGVSQNVWEGLKSAPKSAVEWSFVSV